MNSYIKTKWLNALRSGKYKQGKKALRFKEEAGGGFCCLGVLCDVIDNGRWGIVGDYNFYRYGNSNGSLSIELLEMIDLSIQIESDLIHMNDIENKSFEEIANYIEKYL